MGRIIEGFWDCKYCNTKGIRGGIRECPNCGKARDEDTVFYLDLEKKHYVPKEQEKNMLFSVLFKIFPKLIDPSLEL